MDELKEIFENILSIIDTLKDAVKVNTEATSLLMDRVDRLERMVVYDRTRGSG